MVKNEMMKLGLVLFMITAVVALLLAGVSAVTAEPIEQIQIQIEQDALAGVLPDAEFEEVPVEADAGAVLKVFKATKGGEVVGHALTVAPGGFGGPITMVVGVDTEGKVTGIDITDHAETPGLGTKADTPEFASDFVGMTSGITVIKGTPAENQIAALSSATITTQAVVDGVNLALDYASGLE